MFPRIAGKKAIESFIVVLFVIIAIGALLTKGGMDKKQIVEIGERQALILSSYAEGEKVREYLNQAARFAAMEAANEAGAQTGDGCFASVGNTALDKNFREKIKTYTNAALSTKSEYEVILPSISWAIQKSDNQILITGTTTDKIKINGGDFDYNAGIYVNQKVTCDDFKKFSEAYGSAALLAG